MGLSREIKFTLSALIVANLIVAFGSMALLSRMTPAIEIILRENVYSIEAVEQMLALIARDGYGEDPSAREELRSNYERARQNVTEEAERPLLGEIESNLEPMISGDESAKQAVVRALEDLGRVNRSAMQAADARAEKLGTAGAWAVVFIEFFAFLTGLLVLKRLNARVVNPVQEILSTLEAWRQGNTQRRCRRVTDLLELQEAIDDLNLVLDNQAAYMRANEHSVEPKVSETERPIAQMFLERYSEPAFVLSDSGEIILANQKGLRELGGKNGIRLRNELDRAARCDSSKLVPSVQRVPGTSYVFATALADG